MFQAFAAFFLFAGSVIVLPANIFAQSLETKVTLNSDGTATIVFQPAKPQDHVTVFTRNGKNIATLNWAALFEVTVNEQVLRNATKPEGIDIHSLISAIGTLKSGSKTLVEAQLPIAVVADNGRELKAGTKVYFGLNTLALSGTVAPVGAWGGDTVAIKNFNAKLEQRGVVGVEAPSERNEVASRRTHRDIHGQPRVGFDSGDVTNNGLGEKFLTSPTCSDKGGRFVMTSYFGRRAAHRTSNGRLSSTSHRGLDIAGAAGSSVVAAADGCVQKKLTNRKVGYGLSLFLEHADGYVSQYAHMRSFAQSRVMLQCKSGRGFRRGDTIGFVGATGNTTGNNLHFAVFKDGNAVDPKDHLMAEDNRDLSLSCETLKANIAAMTTSSGSDATMASNRTDTSPGGSEAKSQTVR